MVEFDLEFMGKEWDSFSNNTNSALGGQSLANKNENTPFTKRGKPIGGWCEKDRQANQNFQKWNEEWAREALRICKPGAFMFVCGGSRTFHRLACAVEDAGWIIRDDIMVLSSMNDRERALFASLNSDQQQAFLELFASQSLLLWTYGSGFPKGYSIDKGIDKKLGKEREVVGQRKHPTLKDTNKIEEQANAAHGENKWAREWDLTSPASAQAKLFDGYNVSFKPAFEPILVCMKKTDGGFANNAIRWGIAGINVDAGRIGGIPHHNYGRTCAGGMFTGKSDTPINTPSQGRYPANLILSHSPDCVRIGEKKVKGIQTTNYGPHKTQPGAHGTMSDGWNGDKIVQGYSDENGNETIEEWECSPSCPIRQMNESVGSDVSRYFLNLNVGLQSCIKTVKYVEKNFMLDLMKYVEDLENFVPKNVMLKVEKDQREKNLLVDFLIKEINDGIEFGEKKEVEKHIDKLKQDGYGKKNMEKFQKEWISITLILIRLIIELKIYSVSQNKNIDTIINELERIIYLLMELNIDDANTAKSINHLIITGQDLLERFVDIVKNVPKNKLKNGEVKISKKQKSIVGDIMQKRKDYLNPLLEIPRFLYFPKASRAEREKGCENIPVKECQTGCGGAMPIDDQGKDRDRFKKVASNVHPTVKNLSLIKYLASLLKMPTHTLILDMFAGSGTLGIACEQLKIPYLLIEKEEEYCDIIRARVAAANEPDRPAKRKKIVKPTNTLIPWEEITNDQNA